MLARRLGSLISELKKRYSEILTTITCLKDTIARGTWLLAYGQSRRLAWNCNISTSANSNAGLRAPIGQGGLTGIDAKAGTLSTLGYLPLPVPFLDVYGRLGVARLHTTTTEVGPAPYLCPAIEGNSCLAPVSDISDWSTNLAYGAGVQGKIGSLAIRAEYERISSTGGNRSIRSL